MVRTTTILFLITLSISCSTRPKYWDVSKFIIVPKALSDNEKIKILYVGPATNDKDYYTHLVVVSEEKGDTVNILTTADNGITFKDKDKIFNYFDPNNAVSKVAEMNPDSLINIKGQESIDKIVVKKRSKVLRDPNFDSFASNNFPTVIGTIGTMTEAK